MKRIDLAIAAAVLVVSSIWGAVFWNTWVRQGNSPEFYQIYFEPAVMIACGKGFVIAEHQPKNLEDFLWRRRDRLECSELPADLKLGRKGIYQGAWTYLEYAVGFAWRVLGISWSGMGPLFGLFFGTVTTLAYGIFRLGMGPPIALAGAFGVGTSSLHLINLPHLRDYAKAPFTLGLVLILGWLVTRPVTRRTVLLLSAAYGAVLGFGYGFRTDLLIDLPVIVIALFLFLDGGLLRNVLLKTAAAALFVLTFVIVSWPVTSSVVEKGGCQWHVALLGLQSPFESALRLTPAPYDFGYAYADGYVIAGVQGFAQRVDPGVAKPIYCSHAYDVYSGRELTSIVKSFPGDFVARAYASVLQIVELPYLHLAPPADGWMARLFRLRSVILRPRHSWGALFALVALLITSAASVRLGLFLLFFVMYFGGYPAVQFQARHYFPLEFIGWWTMGLAAHHAIATVRAWRRDRASIEPLIRRLAYNGAVVLASAIVVCGALLGATRWSQSRSARQLFGSYLAAAKTPLENPGAPLQGIAASDWPQMVEVDLDEAACGEQPAVTFRYDPAFPDVDFTRTMTVSRRTAQAGPTRIVLPVFERFTGLQFSDARPGCVLGVYRFTDLKAFPLLLGATLPPDWASLPLYQRIARWERDPS